MGITSDRRVVCQGDQHDDAQDEPPVAGAAGNHRFAHDSRWWWRRIAAQCIQKKGVSIMAVLRPTVVAGQQPVGERSEAVSLAQLVDMILDKGIVIDRWASVSVLGLELLTTEARTVVTFVETYLRYGDAIARLAPAARPPWQRAVSGRDRLNRPS
jgi:Gas vesicle protein